MKRFLPAVLCLAVAFPALAADKEKPFSAADLEFFEKNIRPVLVEHCYECHSAKSGELEAGLRLDYRDGHLKGGDTGAAIISGKPEESRLVEAITYEDVDLQMPPNGKLPAAKIAALTEWIKRRAPWPKEAVAGIGESKGFDLEKRKAEHWCWQPIENSKVPATKNRSWAGRPLDAFILAKLEAAGLKPSGEADRRTLIRRAYFDLIGLPPSPEEVEAFVNDSSPDAFEKVVDGLLDSPHFGERWARHWMDLVRYAESHGHEFDYVIHHAWKYRDYLIRAFNADVPYDRFIHEHLAGDLLPNPRRNPDEGFNESVIGTGFWWLGEATHAPVDVRGDEAGRIDNQLDVMSKTFLGLTVSCARCHDHKFDAITMKDYYGLAGFLQSSRRNQALLDRHGKIAAATAQIGELRSEAEAILAGSLDRLSSETIAKYLLGAREVLHGDPKKARPVDIVSMETGLDSERLGRWVAALSSDVVKQTRHPLHLWSSTAAGAADEAAFATQRKRVDAEQQRLSQLQKTHPRLVNFEDGMAGWFADGDAFDDAPTGAGSWNWRDGQAALAEPGLVRSHATSRKLRGVLRSPTFLLDHRAVFVRMRGEGVKVRLILDGYYMYEFNKLLFKGFEVDVKNGSQFQSYQLGGDVGRYTGHRAYIEIIDHGDGWAELDEVRFSSAGAPPAPPSPLAALILKDDSLDSREKLAAAYGKAWQSKAGRTELVSWLSSNGLVELAEDKTKKLAALRDQVQKLAESIPAPDHVLALTEGTSENERVFIRGNPRTLGAEAPRQLLTAIAGNQPPIRKGSGRMELAQRIASEKNPLTSRVIVNQLWHHLFGRGIVGSTDNFGVLGQRPTHPELLDHLAKQFTRDGWSIKKFLKYVMLSSTYRMSSTPIAAAEKADPENLLLHRQRIRRLQGEAIRDAILAVSGRLDRKQFGPSVPVFLTSFMNGRGRPRGGPLDGDGRRSVYILVRRNFLSPMMLAFDMPIPFNPVGRRNVSNVPSQALILMNDPFVVEQSKVWAKSLVKDQAKTADERIRSMYLTAFSTPPSERQTALAKAFLETQAKEYSVPAERLLSDERVWADFGHVLINTKPFIYLY